jgi:hypothetical protein
MGFSDRAHTHKNRSFGCHCWTKFSRDNVLVGLVNFDKVTRRDASERPVSRTISTGDYWTLMGDYWRHDKLDNVRLSHCARVDQ